MDFVFDDNLFAGCGHNRDWKKIVPK